VRSRQACLREILGGPCIEEQGGLINLVDPEDAFEFDLDRTTLSARHILVPT
jgi:hypothetical protein